jgi:hypothetical protein
LRRTCERCGTEFEAKTSRRRFCGSTCRARKAEGRPAPGPKPKKAKPRTDVAEALLQELQKLRMANVYEGRVALGIARQLDTDTVVGAAYASLSRELDRRVEALRLKAERADDPAKVIKGRLEEKRAKLA